MKLTSDNTVPAIIGLSIVLSVAMFFRFSGLAEQLIFSTDQARAMLAGRNILLGHLTLSGPETSVAGISLGPLYYYLTAIALWFSNFQPIGPARMVAGMSTLTCGIVSLYVWRNWKNNLLALLSGLILALSPLVLWQGRIAIEPTPLPLVVILWLWSLTEALRSRSRAWWIAASLWPLLAVQLNLSAGILWGVQFVVWSLFTSRLSQTNKARVLGSGLFLTGLAVLLKIPRGTTELTYWWQKWSLYTFPDHSLATIILGILLAATILFWTLRFLEEWQLQRYTAAPETLLLVFSVMSGVAFTLKTVGGDHSLGIIYVVPAIILPLALRPLLQRVTPSILILGSLLFFGLWAHQSFLWLQNTNHGLTIQDHQVVVDEILTLTTGEPYNLVYRGHLDVYDAADDHYQYLLWLAGNPPQQSARIALEEQYFERWLLPPNADRRSAEKTLYLYYPATALDRYAQQGTLYFTGKAAVDVVE